VLAQIRAANGLSRNKRESQSGIGVYANFILKGPDVAMAFRCLSFLVLIGIANADAAQELDRSLDRPKSTEQTSDAVRRESQLVISVVLSGAQHVSRVECITIADPLEKYTLLRLPQVCDEIELGESHRPRLASAIKRADDVRREMLQRMWGASSAQARSDLQDWFGEQQAAVIQTVSGLLVPGQEKRLGQIRHRTSLRLNGWPDFIRRCQNEGLIDWELSPGELADLAESASQLKEVVLAETKQLHAELLEELFHELEESQVESIKRIANKLTEATGALDLFRLHLNPDAKIEDRDLAENAAAAESVLKRIRQPVFYIFDPDGSLVRPKTGSLDNFNVPLRSDRIEWYADLFESLCFGDLGRQLGISDSQSDQVFDSLQELSAFRERASQFLEKSQNPLLDSENLMDMQSHVQEKIQLEMDGLFSEDQLKRLEVIVDLADLVRIGLLPSLLEGRLNSISLPRKRRSDRGSTAA